ncbi:putative glycolipid-binding domain-containing protein [Corynebacterium sanguinis]|uniref:putative glycolipid-binding domain-containing protein n=1 Tax=Corynebacterium sanguinis TaxID=2594913 RepID=UPI0021A5FBF2|nr:putative glycolipid-binding domain-containing protein [Corynebacterium sanguinis]MCT1445303.1 putative glycolipid-binding domain-containing protein [Corynebacterium sanguinis]
MERTYAWQHINNPSIRNEARVRFHDAGLSATGTQHGEGYRAAWTLSAVENWVTQRVAIDVVGEGWRRHLDLVRTDSGEWTPAIEESGIQPLGLPSPGIAESADLSAALDCDLALCPLTNTMPIRRLGLLEAEVPSTQLLMAWIDVPSLQVIASDQYYSSINPGAVRYSSGTRGVDVELEVDREGVVL